MTSCRHPLRQELKVCVTVLQMPEYEMQTRIVRSEASLYIDIMSYFLIIAYVLVARAQHSTAQNTIRKTCSAWMSS